VGPDNKNQDREADPQLSKENQKVDMEGKEQKDNLEKKERNRFRLINSVHSDTFGCHYRVQHSSVRLARGQRQWIWKNFVKIHSLRKGGSIHTWTRTKKLQCAVRCGRGGDSVVKKLFLIAIGQGEGGEQDDRMVWGTLSI